MFCRFCGAHVGIGNPHDCPKAPRLHAAAPDTILGWRLGSLGAVVVGVSAAGVAIPELLHLLRAYQLADAGGSPGSSRLHDLQAASNLFGAVGAWLAGLALVISVLWAKATLGLVERLGRHEAAGPATTTLTLGRASAVALFGAGLFAWFGQPGAAEAADTVADADLVNLIVTVGALIAAGLLAGAGLTALVRVGRLLVVARG